MDWLRTPQVRRLPPRTTAMPADLDGVLAHELGHVNTADGKLTEALNRLVLWGDLVGPV